MKVKVDNTHTGDSFAFEGSEESIKNQLMAQFDCLRQMQDTPLLDMIDYLDSQQVFMATIDADSKQMGEMVRRWEQVEDPFDAPEHLTPALEGCEVLPEGLRDFWAPEED